MSKLEKEKKESNKKVIYKQTNLTRKTENGVDRINNFTVIPKIIKVVKVIHENPNDGNIGETDIYCGNNVTLSTTYTSVELLNSNYDELMKLVNEYYS